MIKIQSLTELPEVPLSMYSGDAKDESEFDFFYESPTKHVKMYFKIVPETVLHSRKNSKVS